MSTSSVAVAVFVCGLHSRRPQNSHLVMVVVRILPGDRDFNRNPDRPVKPRWRRKFGTGFFYAPKAKSGASTFISRLISNNHVRIMGPAIYEAQLIVLIQTQLRREPHIAEFLLHPVTAFDLYT